MIIAPVVMLATTLQDVDGAALYKRVLPSIATLSVVHKDGKSSLGTGFLAYKPGLMVTAWHVIENAKTVTAKFSDGEEFECTGIVDKDVNRDIAVIRVKAVGKPLLAVADEKPDVGSKAFVVGAPRGLDFSISDGIVSQVDTIEGKKVIQYTCPSSPGNSGGPLLDSTGKVRGVVSFLLRDSQNLNFAVPVSYVSGLDLSLATVPWDSVVATPIRSSQANVLDTRNFEEAVMLGIRMQQTAEVLYYNTGALLRDSKFNLNGPSSLMVTIARKLVDYLDNHSNDSATTRENTQILNELRHVVFKWWSAVDALVRGMNLSQKQNRWTNDAINYLKSADVYVNEARDPDKGSNLRKFMFSSEFVKKLPIGLRWQPTDIQFGILCWPDSPLTMGFVVPDGFAHSLGFRTFDHLVRDATFTGKDDVDIVEFVRANLGKKVKVTVMRDGKPKELELKIPDEIPAKYRRN